MRGGEEAKGRRGEPAARLRAARLRTRAMAIDMSITLPVMSEPKVPKRVLEFASIQPAEKANATTRNCGETSDHDAITPPQTCERVIAAFCMPIGGAACGAGTAPTAGLGVTVFRLIATRLITAASSTKNGISASSSNIGVLSHRSSIAVRFMFWGKSTLSAFRSSSSSAVRRWSLSAAMRAALSRRRVAVGMGARDELMDG